MRPFLYFVVEQRGRDRVKRLMNSLAMLWALKDVDKWGMVREKIFYREGTA